MPSNTHQEAEAHLVWRHLLQQLLDGPIEAVAPSDVPWDSNSPWDDMITCRGHLLAIEYKVRSDTASLLAVLERIRLRRSGHPNAAHPLLVVNHMGPTGRDLCERAGMDWLDTAGNASITHLPGLRIVVEGKKPYTRTRGRKSNVFAPKSSRVAHWLLLHREGTHSQKAIVDGTQIDKGHLSRILVRMEELRLIRRTKGGITLVNPAVMLDAWREAYEPPCRKILKGVIPSRSGMETVETLGSHLSSAQKRYAIGGLSAAWLLDSFSDFRLTTCYVDGSISNSLLKDINFIETERGANVWFMESADEVAFLGLEWRGELSVTSPWFTYVDLLQQPERSKEAADHLRESMLQLEESR
jgi:hypothetical protein